MYTFKKEERLCSKKLLDKLFNNGSSFVLYPYRITWIYENIEPGVAAQVVISVPKRRFKRAVDRNLLKRRIREVYRLNKGEDFYPFIDQKQILLAIAYISNDILDSPVLEKKLRLVFKKLVNLHNESSVE